MSTNKHPDYKTSRFERFSYGFYFLGQLIFYGIVMGFLQLFLTNSGIPAATVGVVFIIAKIWDAVNDPLFGVIVDKAHLKKGKYIPWIRLSSFLIPLTTIFMFAMPMNVSIQVKVIWAAIAYMLWDTSYTICDVPIFALATSMTDNLKERDGLYLLNRFFVLVGSLLVLILVPALYPTIGWTATAVILSVIGMATMLPVGYKAKERYYTESEKNPKISELFRYIFKNKPLLIFNGASIISCLSATSGAVGSYVAIYCLGGPEWISILGVAAALPMLISVIVTQQIVKKVDKFTVYTVCSAINIALGVLLFFAGYENKVIFLLIVIVRSIFSSAAGILGVMFTADCSEYGHFATGDRAQGMAFSIQTFTAKLTAALSGGIGMFALAAIGFVEGENAPQSDFTIEWMWVLYTLIPLIMSAVALVFLIIGYKLRNKDVGVMMKANAGEITREEALAELSGKFKFPEQVHAQSAEEAENGDIKGE